MKKFFKSHVAIILLAFLAVFISPLFALAVETAPGEVIVMFKNPVNTKVNANFMRSSMGFSSAQSIAASAGAEIKETYDALSQEGNAIFALVHSNTKSEYELLEEFKARPDVLGVQLNYKIRALSDSDSNSNSKIKIFANNPNDYNQSTLWGLKAINAPAVWNNNIIGSNNVYVAVIDSGVSQYHEDLNANFENKNYSRNFTGANYEYYQNFNYIDENGHGTHVAGTIGAVGNNNIGVVGVNWRTKIIALRVLNDKGSGYTSWCINAINYLIGLLQNNPNLKLGAVNLSLGGYSYDSPDYCINQKLPEWTAYKTLSDMNRAVICVAAGNESVEVGKPTTQDDVVENVYKANQYCYPASFKGIDNMIVVAAADNNSGYTKANYSNFSTQYVDIAAPGSSIYSTYLNNYNSYAYMSGTSMATPHVAGAAALLKSAYPDATASQIKQAILEGANASYAKSYTAHGFLDVNSALNKLKTITSNDWTTADDESNNEEDDEESAAVAPVFTGGITLPQALVGQSYKYKIPVNADATTPLIWSFQTTSSYVPSNFSFNTSTGELSCKPTTPGTLTLSVTVSNTAGGSTKQFKLLVKDVMPAMLTPNSLPNATPGSYYSQTIQASGTNLKWSTGTDWPSWLRLSSSAGATTATIYGTAPNYPGAQYIFGIKLSNGWGSTTRYFRIRVKDNIPTITTTSLPNGSVGKSYNVTLSAIGKNITWSGSTINGLSVSSNGKITGTPVRAGTYNFTVRASNTGGYVYKVLRLVVNDVKPVIKTTSLPNAITSKSYSATLSATGSNLKWSGSSVNGLRVSSTGKISGRPSKSGTYKITVKATNSMGSATKTLKIVVKDEKPVFSTTSLKAATVGKTYRDKIYVNGRNLTLSKVGSLPAGLSIRFSKLTTRSYAEISGKPTKAGTYNVKIRAKNAGGTVTKTLKLKVTGAAPVIKTSSLKTGTLKKSYSATLSATGTGVKWNIASGSLPPGLKMTSAGKITGKPTKAGIYTFKVKAKNSSGSVTKTLRIKINKK